MDVDNRTADVAAKPLRLLVVEDSPQDAEIAVREIRRGGFDVTWKRVETAEAMRAALDAEPWDAVVADYRMPNFDGLAALRVLQEKGLDIPFIIISGTIGEETAVAAMKAGAHDYLMKDRLARLAPTIDRELRDAAVRREQRRLEKGMREAARQWRTTFDAMNDAVCLIDKDLRIVRCNRLFCNLVGKPWDKILGQTYYSIVHGCAAPIADCPVVRARESRHHESLLLEMKGRWWALAADPVLDDAGQLIGLVQVMVDVTEQRAAEAALRKQERLLRSLIDSLDAVVYVADMASYELLLVNQYFKKYWGDGTGNICWQTLQTGQSGPCPFCTNDRLVDAEGRPTGVYVWEFQNTITGQWFQCRDIAIPWLDGRMVRMEIAVDITERKRAETLLKESESRLATIFDNDPSGIILVNIKTRTVYDANQAAVEMMGLPKENLVGKVCHKFLCPAEEGHCPICDLGQRVDRSERVLIRADGKQLPILKTVAPIKISGEEYLLENFIDITERKQAEVNVRERMKELWALYSLAELAQREGITLDELYKEFTNILPKSWLYAEIACARLVIGDSEFRTENFAESPWMQSAPIMVNSEVVGRIEVGYLEERPEESEGSFLEEERFLIDAIAKQLGQITERKRAEETLRESEMELATIFDGAPVLMLVVDGNYRVRKANRTAQAAVAATEAELRDVPCGEVLRCLHRLDSPDGCCHGPTCETCALRQAVQNTLETGLGVSGVEADFEMEPKGQPQRRSFSLSTSLLQIGGEAMVLVCIEDITERKQAEEKLVRLSRHNELILSSAAEGILGLDLQGNHTFINMAASKILGYEAEELLGRPSHSIWHHTKPDGSPFPKEECGIYATCREGVMHKISTEVFWRKDGTCLPVEYASTPIYEQGWLAGAVVTFMDISERKRAEEAQVLNSRRTLALLQLNQMTYATLQEITDFALEEAVRLTQSKIGYLAFLNEDESVLTMHAWSKSAMAECAIDQKPIVYPVETTGLWGEAVRQRQPVITNDYTATSPLKKGYPQGHVAVKRHMNVPVFEGSRIVIIAGVGNKAEDYDQGDAQQLTLLVEGMWRLLERKRAENDLKQSYNSLQDSLTGAVQAMATVVESRDPYTAGHQRRVAELAHAIASEMRLPTNQIDGIRMAAVIHDLGKIAVPAEILSKPTKLKKTEFELIQDHPQAGYEILKDIVFPWPIARIILEHHEKMDGSGYPNGSVGENTLLESKILTVADVVEAMASHRPYRPALGIDAALKEIEKNKGTYYDATVVDTCLRLFREKGYQLEGA